MKHQGILSYTDDIDWNNSQSNHQLIILNETFYAFKEKTLHSQRIVDNVHWVILIEIEIGHIDIPFRLNSLRPSKKRNIDIPYYNKKGRN